MNLEGTPVLVVGMHRSGTSAVTRALRVLGVYLGEEKDLIPADEGNRDGYWEHRALVNANDTLLARFGLLWQSAGLLPSDWPEYEQIASDMDRLQGFMSRVFAGHAYWGWKDPRTTLLLPVYREILERAGLDPIYVICLRNPLDVAASLQRRDGFSQREALGLWLRYTLDALHETVGKRRAVVVYEDFVHEPRRALESVVRLERDWAVGETVWKQVAELPNGSLNHGQQREEEVDRIQPEIVSRVYRLCVEASRNGMGLMSGAFDAEIEDLWSEFQAWWSIPAPGARYGSAVRLEGVPRGGAPIHSATAYLPSGKPQTVKVSLQGLCEGDLVTGSFSDRAGSMYLRSAKVRDANGLARTISLEPEIRVRITAEDGRQKWTFIAGGSHFHFLLPNVAMPATFEAEFVSVVNPYEAMRQTELIGEECVALRRRVIELEGKIKQMAKQMAGMPAG